eukprot:774995-Rhodomonas_salina.1
MMMPVCGTCSCPGPGQLECLLAFCLRSVRVIDPGCPALAQCASHHSSCLSHSPASSASRLSSSIAEGANFSRC